MTKPKRIKPTKKQFIDRFLRLELKDNRPELNFDCPASIAFQKHPNKEEAEKKWLERDE